MIRRAAMGQALCRVYRWSRMALSFPRSADMEGIDASRLESEGIAVVRRPTGGGILVHGFDLSWSVAVPRSHPWAAGGIDEAGRMLARPVLEALRFMSYDARFRELRKEGRGEAGRSRICFLQESSLDIMIEGRKVAAFAQRRTAGALFQHGSVEIEPVDRTLAVNLERAGVGTREEWAAAFESVSCLNAVRRADRKVLAAEIICFSKVIPGLSVAV